MSSRENANPFEELMLIYLKNCGVEFKREGVLLNSSLRNIILFPVSGRNSEIKITIEYPW